jgi:hypothetical protein
MFNDDMHVCMCVCIFFFIFSPAIREFEQKSFPAPG